MIHIWPNPHALHSKNCLNSVVTRYFHRAANLRLCKATGTRIILPLIYGVGSIRQRYPIMPVHGEGSAVWKELEAMKDVILESQSNGYILREPLTAGGPIPTEPPRKDIKFQVMTALKTPVPGPHEHEITLTADQVREY